MILFIAGPLGAGKSTVAEILRNRMRRAAIVEPDVLRKFIADIPLDKAVPIVLELTALVAKGLVKAGYNVIIPYPLSEKNYLFLRTRLRGQKLHFFVLSPHIDTIENGRGKRKLDGWEKRRVRYHYKIKLHNPSFGVKIDNTKQKPGITASIIQQRV